MKNEWDISETLLGTSPLPETIISPIDGAEMVLVPEGDFIMGITQEDLYKILLLDEKENPIFTTEMPSRSIHLKSYYMDRYPVTNYQYRKFIEQTGHREPILLKHVEWGRPMQPVVFVGWDDARAYAHWEKAGRGTDARWYSWGNEFLPNYCNSREFELGHTSDIGLFDQGMSIYGCYDMCGNVWEMCEGTWLEDTLPMRGGCFLGASSFVRVTCRWTPEDPVDGAHWLGFRCMKEIPIPL